MRDTSAEAAEVQIAAFRRLSPAERVAMAFEASEWLMMVARARDAALPPPVTPAGDTAVGRSRAAPHDNV